MTVFLLTLTLTYSIQVAPADPSVQDRETLIDLDVKDADVLDVLRLLAEVGGFNLVADPDVSCDLTLKLWDFSAVCCFT